MNNIVGWWCFMSDTFPNARNHFEIDRRKVAKYLLLSTIVAWESVPGVTLILSMLLIFGSPRPVEPMAMLYLHGFTALIVVIAVIAYILSSKQAAAFSYWMEKATLRIDEGVLCRSRKSIPLDRITDIELFQGPLMRLWGIWGLAIQTAGSAQASAEGTLYGLMEPEQVRDTIMMERDAASSRGDAS